MRSKHNQALSAATIKLLRPLVRIFLRNGSAFRSFGELLKHVYVDVAHREFGLAGKRTSTSRIAILTGLTRKEVQRLLRTPRASQIDSVEEYNRAARVVSGWVRDQDFSDGKGHPLPLRMEGRRSFPGLVKRYSGDIPARAMFDELLRVGAVKYLKDGRICLRARAYIPQKSPTAKLQILGSDTADLITTIEHNLHNATQPRFQRKVMYDNVPLEAAKEFRVLSAAQGHELLESLDRWLSQRDRDVNPSVRGTGRMRVGIGIYHFEERLDSEG